MSNKIEITRELAERILKFMDDTNACYPMPYEIRQELRALLAAPVVERQPDAWGNMLPDWNDDDRLLLTSKEALEEHVMAPGSVPLTTLYTSPPAPVAVVLPERDPMPITEGMARLMEAYRLGEFRLEGGSPTVEALSCESYDENPAAVRDHDFDSYAAGYQSAMYEQAKSLLGLIACLDKIKELNP